MPSENFRKFIDDICKLAKIPNSQTLHNAADLEIDQIKFTLHDGASKSEDAIAFFCDFGLLPPQVSRANALQRLLELNLAMFGVNTPTFSINGQSNHVLLMGRIPIRDVSAEKLLNILAEYAAKAKEWQKTYYLTAKEQSLQNANRQSHHHLIKKRAVA